MVKRPEDYRWSSLGYHIQTGNKDDFLSLDFGLKEFGVMTNKERLRHYRKYVYEAASQIIREDSYKATKTTGKKRRSRCGCERNKPCLIELQTQVIPMGPPGGGGDCFSTAG